MKFVTLIATAVAVSSVSGAAIERRAGGKVCSQYQAEIGTYNTATPINKACVALVRYPPFVVAAIESTLSDQRVC